MGLTAAKKILVVGPAWVGDMVMTHTLFQVLKQQHPDALLDVLAPQWSHALLQRMPEVRNAMVLPLQHGELNIALRYRLGQQLRAEHYDQAILVPNSFKSALIPWFASINQRTGWYGKEWPRRWLLNDGRSLDKKRFPLMVQRFAALGLPSDVALPDPLPLPQLQYSREGAAAALTRHQLDFPQQPLLALAPGAEFGPSKRWPTSHFAAVANWQLDQGWQVWLFGSSRDQPVAAEIDQLTQNRCVNLVGKTRLDEVIDLLALARVVVSNDSGLMHIAAAVQRPVVALYGSTPADVTPPLTERHISLLRPELPCRPCGERHCPLQHHRCMVEIMPGHVMESIERLLQ